jgi:hypothetical protein
MHELNVPATDVGLSVFAVCFLLGVRHGSRRRSWRNWGSQKQCIELSGYKRFLTSTSFLTLLYHGSPTLVDLAGVLDNKLLLYPKRNFYHRYPN